MIDGEHSLIRLKLHRSQERYYHKEELFPLSSRTGERIYFHAKPYILIPEQNNNAITRDSGSTRSKSCRRRGKSQTAGRVTTCPGTAGTITNGPL